jgi:hypothetical protein
MIKVGGAVEQAFDEGIALLRVSRRLAELTNLPGGGGRPVRSSGCRMNSASLQRSLGRSSSAPTWRRQVHRSAVDRRSFHTNPLRSPMTVSVVAA